MKKAIPLKRCQALNRYGKQCKKRWHWKVPNTISGTGIGKNDWKNGRPVFMCIRHGVKRIEGSPVKLIHGGIAQAYNQYGYGNIVLSELVDWKKLKKKYNVPEFWK